MFNEIGSQIKDLDLDILQSFSTVTDMYLFSIIALVAYLLNPSTGVSSVILELNDKRMAYNGNTKLFLNEYICSKEFVEDCQKIYKIEPELSRQYFDQLQVLLTHSEIVYLSGAIFSSSAGMLL